MEREVWTVVTRMCRRLADVKATAKFTFTDADVLLVYLWAVLQSRPTYWACQRDNWPESIRPARLPCASTLSRRLRRPAMNLHLRRALRQLQCGRARGLLSILDGKPLPISKHSRDPDSGFGRGVGGLAKGYKLHYLRGKNGRLEDFRVCSLNQDERVVGRALLARTTHPGYVLVDRNYDDNQLYEVGRRRGVQVLAPRRYGPLKGLGHRRHSPARLRAIEAMEHSHTGFGRTLHARRGDIERDFAHLSSAWYGLQPLPTWVRRQHRVELWVTARLLLFTIATRRRER
jgi:hypothetical protein